MQFDFPIYSPEEELFDPLFIDHGIRLLAKRDDKIHPFISGNKWRKLKYNLEDAQLHKKNILITFGGAWSNHLLATAAAAAQFKFKSIGIVRGEQVDNPVLNLCRLFGMKLHFVDRSSYRDKIALYQQFETTDSYFLDEGGRSSLAVKGCTELISELQQEYDYIAVAAGTGTTASGLLEGIKQYHLNSKLQVFPVLKQSEHIKNEYPNLKEEAIHLDWCPDYHFNGYAKTNPSLNQFVHHFVAQTGMLIEPTYTGKLLFGIFDKIKQKHYPAGSKILVIHTGGLTGLLGYLETMKLND